MDRLQQESSRTWGFTSETRNNRIWMYTLLFVITTLGSYILFLKTSRTFLTDADGNVDGIAELYPAYAEIKRRVGLFLHGGGLSSWSWDIGLGENWIVSSSAKLMNPLTYLVIAFPYKYLDVGFTLMVVISQYLSGLSFMAFAHGVKLNNRQAVVGGLCYAFSGWAFWAISHMATFLMAMILLPLLMLGTEKVLRRESPLLLIAAVAMHLLYSVQWSLVAGIIVLLYFPVRYFTEYGKDSQGDAKVRRFVTEFLGFCGYGIIGILISSVVLIQNVLQLGGAVTSSTVKNEILYTVSQYFSIPGGLYSIDTTTGKYSILTMAAICVVLLPMGLKRVRQKSTPAILTWGLFLLSLIPLTGRIFNGMGYSSCRWFYALIFFAIWMCMEVMKPETFTKKNVRVMAGWLALLGLWTIPINGILLKNANTTDLTACLVGTVLAAALLWVCSRMCQRGSRSVTMRLVAVGLIVVSIVGYTNIELFPHFGERIYEFRTAGSIEKAFDSSTQKVGQKVQQSDSSFYRMDQVDGYTDTRVARVRANENMYFGNRSIYEYASTISANWLYFNKMVGNNAGYFDRTTSFSNDNREGLDLLMGVKYFLGDSKTKKPGASEYAGYGFSHYETIDGVEVLKNRYGIGLGATFDRYITMSEWLNFSPLDREQVLLQTAVIEDDEVNRLQGVSHEDVSEIKTQIEEIPFEIVNPENITIDAQEGQMTVYGKKDVVSSFDLRIPETTNRRIMVCFENLQKEELSYDQYLAINDKKDNRNKLAYFVKASSFDDDDKFQIKVTKGNVFKAAQMRKGKNQGFSDVNDFNINLGYFDRIRGDINVSINTKGIYDYDRIHVYAVPMNLYDQYAGKLQANHLNITGVDGNRVTGTISNDQDSVLYLSVLKGSGWNISIDGQKIDKLSSVDMAFSGCVIRKGSHDVVLEYRTPHVALGWMLTGIGLLLAVISIIVRRKQWEPISME